MIPKHKVFLSYYNDEDQEYRRQFEEMFHEVIAPRSVNAGDIAPNENTERVFQLIRENYLADSTVTIVLIGKHTWQRMFVDWEIYASLRQTTTNPRSGLIGIILPTYPRNDKRYYDGHTIPPRLFDNLKSQNGNKPFASIHNWNPKAEVVKEWIHSAYSVRKEITPINNRMLLNNDLSGEKWRNV